MYSETISQALSFASLTISGQDNIKCTGTGNGGEVNCVEEDVISGAESSMTGFTTIIASYVATATPVFTITGPQTVPTVGTQAAPTATQKSSGRHIMVSLASASVFVFIGVAYVLFPSIF